METLGKAANLAVFKPSEKTTDDENNDSDDCDVDDGTHSNVQEDDVDQDEDLIRGRPKIHFVTDSGIWPLRGEGVYY